MIVLPYYNYMLIAFLAIVYVKLKKYSSADILKMPLWLSISFSFLILTCLFSGISYKIGSVLEIIPYLLFCLIIMVVGEKIGRSAKLKNGKRIVIKEITLTILSIVGAILFIYDIFRLNNVFLGLRIDDFQTSLLGAIGNILASLGLIAWLSSLYRNRILNEKFSMMSIIPALSFVAGGLFTAGRQAILILLISSLILLIWGNKKRKEIKTLKIKSKRKSIKLWLIVGLLLFSGVSYFSFIAKTRSLILDRDTKIRFFESQFHAKTSDETYDFAKNMGSLGDMYIEFLYYYSHEIIRLDILFKYYDAYPVFGLSEFSYIERRFQWLFGKQEEYSWQQVEKAISEKGGFSPHTWGTFISSYIVDFGRIGTVIACFITGYLIGLSYKKLLREDNCQTVISHIIILCGVVFSIQYSPFAELIWTFPMIISRFLIIVPRNSTIAA